MNMFILTCYKSYYSIINEDKQGGKTLKKLTIFLTILIFLVSIFGVQNTSLADSNSNDDDCYEYHGIEDEINISSNGD